MQHLNKIIYIMMVRQKLNLSVAEELWNDLKICQYAKVVQNEEGEQSNNILICKVVAHLGIVTNI